ncbi:hypothetical protein ACN28I_17675 [Archangium gephyra]|uniref:hypothetical protein n=1 Tax=Archangium gephyra TaxID=48 RepID=UPI003B7C07A7
MLLPLIHHEVEGDPGDSDGLELLGGSNTLLHFVEVEEGPIGEAKKAEPRAVTWFLGLGRILGFWFRVFPGLLHLLPLFFRGEAKQLPMLEFSRVRDVIASSSYPNDGSMGRGGMIPQPNVRVFLRRERENRRVGRSPEAFEIVRELTCLTPPHDEMECEHGVPERLMLL